MDYLKLKLPRIESMVFELVKVNVESLLNDDSYQAQIIATVSLPEMPESIDYSISGRDAKNQTYSRVFIHRFGWTPYKVHIEATMGQNELIVDGIKLNGWERLQRFESIVVKESKELPEKGFLIYLNYYDFYNQKFGNINLDGFKFRENGKENALLEKFNLDFEIIGPLIDVNEVEGLFTNLLQTLLIPSSGNRLDQILVNSALNLSKDVIQKISEIDNAIYDGINKYSNSINLPTIESIL